jgi:hypothetical protein
MPVSSRLSSVHFARQPTTSRIRLACRTAVVLLALLTGSLPATSAAQPAATKAAVAADPQAQAGARDYSHAFFLQAGVAEDTNMLLAGITWDWPWHRDYAVGRLSGYWEMSFGRWDTDHPAREGSTWVTQFGVTPVLRIYPASWGGRWFVEGGIGVNLLLPVYRSSDKRFSTSFNFGDHLAVGRRFGQQAEHELSLRLQHFSNAGIKSPNPGEDFVQLRYSRRF